LDLFNRTIRKMQHLLLSSAFTQWCNVIKFLHYSISLDANRNYDLSLEEQKKKHAIHLLHKVIGRVLFKKLGTGFWSWISFVDACHRRESKLALDEQHRWHALHVMEVAMKRLQNAQLSIGFRAWHLCVLAAISREEAKATVLHRMGSAIAHMLHKRLSAAFHILKFHARECHLIQFSESAKKKHAIKLLEKMIHHMQQRSASRAWRALALLVPHGRLESERHVIASSQLRRVLLRIQRRNLIRGWNAWRVQIAGEVHELALIRAETLEVQLEDHQVTHAISLMTSALRRGIHIELGKAFRKWHLMIDRHARGERLNRQTRSQMEMERRRHTALHAMERAARKSLHVRTSQAFRGLHISTIRHAIREGDALAEERLSRAQKQHALHLVEKTVTRLLRARLAAAWRSWQLRDHGQQSLDARRKLALQGASSVLGHFKHRRLAAAWRVLADALVAGRLEQEEKQRDRRWSELERLIASGEKLSALDLLHRVVRKLEHQNMSAAWRKWASVTTTSRHEERESELLKQFSEGEELQRAELKDIHGRLSNSMRRAAIMCFARATGKTVLVTLARCMRTWEAAAVERKVGTALRSMGDRIEALEQENQAVSLHAERLLRDLEAQAVDRETTARAIAENERLRREFASLEDEARRMAQAGGMVFSTRSGEVSESDQPESLDVFQVPARATPPTDDVSPRSEGRSPRRHPFSHRSLP
jgi:tetratricopeptide (TPR) repeat protein